MAYRVKTDVFEGPFDLLLQLVSKKKLDVAAVPIAEIADKYLEYVKELKDLDLDVASDFLIVAATLLDLKSAALLPDKEAVVDDEFEEISTDDARAILLTRLLTYKQFKNVSLYLSNREDQESLLHARHAGPDPEFVGLLPDFLKGITIENLAALCAMFSMRKEIILLESEHIAAIPLSVDERAESIHQELALCGSKTFSELIAEEHSPQKIVVTFLAILELRKRNIILIKQDEPFAEIDIDYVDEAFHIKDDEVPASVDEE